MKKEREKGRVLTDNMFMLIIAIIVVGVISIALFCMCKNAEQEKQEKMLLETTPLAETVYWTTLDQFPKYKLEAAYMVEDLMNQGGAEDEACQTAIEYVSDKIYADTMKFIEDNPELNAPEWDESYRKYIEETQQ